MIIVDTPEAFYAMLSDIAGSKTLFIDCETTGLDPHSDRLLLLQLFNIANNYIIDFVKLSLDYIKTLRFILEDSSVVKVFHNAIFDWQILRHLNIECNNLHCTMVTDQILNAGLPAGYSLLEVAKRRLDIDLDKSIRTQFIDRDLSIPFTKEELEYAAQDTEIMEPIYTQQLQEIENKNLRRVYELECNLLPVTASMEYRGLLVDRDRLIQAKELTQALHKRANVSLQDEFILQGASNQIVFGRDGYLTVKPSSHPQVLAAFNSVGIKVESTKGGELSEWDAGWVQKNKIVVEQQVVDVDDDVSSFNHPLLKKHDICGTTTKIEGTFIDGILRGINPQTKRVHAHFNQCGAGATGRYSCSKPNFQQMIKPDKIVAIGLDERCFIRPVFIATPGYQFIIADYSGIELAILAAMSGDEHLLHEVVSGDVHSYVANRLEGDRIEQLLGERITPKNKKQGKWAVLRDSFKKINYSIAYGTTEHGAYLKQYMQLASVGFHISKKDTKRWLDTWKDELFPSTGALLQKNAESAVSRLYTESILGRKRFWPADVRMNKWHALAAMREGMNHPIQSSSADMIKTASYLVHSRLNSRDATIVALVHDEMIVEVKQEKAEEHRQLVHSTMIEAGYLLFPQAPAGLIEVDSHISNCYDK